MSLHAQYGPVVRVGTPQAPMTFMIQTQDILYMCIAPNEISVADVDAVGAVLGSGGLPKGAGL